tara:strand:+ start:880 stop:999 length:120 start_codon:yes stop_codon:yes gene_type:complete
VFYLTGIGTQAEDQMPNKKTILLKHRWFTDRFSYFTPAS